MWLLGRGGGKEEGSGKEKHEATKDKKDSKEDGKKVDDDPLGFGRAAAGHVMCEQDMVPHPKGGVKQTNAQALHTQRTVAWEFLKKIGQNILDQRDIRSVSLPVQIFEPRSYLQRCTDHLAFATTLLTKAAMETDPVERLKYMTAFGVSGCHTVVNMEKPFNPLLGETYRAKFSDGARLYAEQTSHHPPISHWILEGPRDLYKYYGKSEWMGLIRGNNIKGINDAIQEIHFSSDEAIVTMEMPYLYIRGIMWGERIVEYHGDFHIVDWKNGLRCDGSFNPDGKGWLSGWFSRSHSMPSDYLRGTLTRFPPTTFKYGMNPCSNTDMEKPPPASWDDATDASGSGSGAGSGSAAGASRAVPAESQGMSRSTSFLRTTDSANTTPATTTGASDSTGHGEDDKGKKTEEVLAHCEGSWIGALLFDKAQYWNLQTQYSKSELAKPVSSRHALMSDLRYRDDLRALADGDLDLASELKVVLEEKQRYDARLRKAGKKKRALAAS